MPYINKNPQKECTMNKIPNDNIIKVNGEVLHLCEFIKDRLYFTTINGVKDPTSCPSAHFFTIDEEFVYINYYNDFGPLNLAHLYRYCVKLRGKLSCLALPKIIHYTTANPQKRANAAFLIASFAVIFLNRTPKEAYRILLSENGMPFKPFQDASMGNSSYQIRLLECLEGLQRALQFGFVRFNDFCVEEFELYSKLEHGDMNWIVPQKFIAFCGPITNPGPTNHRRPEDYFDYFHKNNVTIVIRLSKREYDAHSTFAQVGIKHYDLYFLDGGIPSMAILNKFLAICEDAVGAIAVHCKAGLGRTGSLIGAYMIKHYRMKAKEVIAWMRICRPGSVIGKQQAWLEDLEEDLWTAGEVFRRKRHGDGQRMPYHKYGVYSIAEKLQSQSGSRPLSPPKTEPPAPRPRVNMRLERPKQLDTTGMKEGPRPVKESARFKGGYPYPSLKDGGLPKTQYLPMKEGPFQKTPYPFSHMKESASSKTPYPLAPMKQGTSSKSAYPCHPIKVAPPLPITATRYRKNLVPLEAGAGNAGACMAGTSGQSGARTPSMGAMRHANPHQLRSKKLAYVTGKLVAPQVPTPKTKPKEEETQGDKLRKVKYFKETASNYVNRAPPKR